MVKTVKIMRGVPGSGKSTRAFNAAYHVGTTGGKACTVSADQFFESTGRYVFNAAKLPQAHADCFRRFVDALLVGCDLVIVDNTNTQVWEFENYAKVACLAGYDVEIDEVRPKDAAELRVWAERCVHGVPHDKIIAMDKRWETFDLNAAWRRWKGVE